LRSAPHGPLIAAKEHRDRKNTSILWVLLRLKFYRFGAIYADGFQEADAGASWLRLFFALASMLASINRAVSFLRRARAFSASNSSTSAFAVGSVKGAERFFAFEDFTAMVCCAVRK